MQEIKKIAVIGAGAMGNGIAHVFAQFGFSVTLVDQNNTALEKAKAIIAKNLERQAKKQQLAPERIPTILDSIELEMALPKGVKDSDLVIEAITENQKAKAQVISQLDQFTKETTIIASNTSSISITSLAAHTKKPHLVIGMHFMNPVPLMPLVEIIKGHHTNKETLKTIEALTTKINKQAVLAKDYPGFVANRILMPMINEAIETLFQGIANIKGIDAIMMGGMKHPMGPLQLADFIGLDVCLSILEVMHEGFKNPKYAPCPLLVKMVASGHLGRKTGIGFYHYKDPKNPIPNPLVSQ